MNDALSQTAALHRAVADAVSTAVETASARTVYDAVYGDVDAILDRTVYRDESVQAATLNLLRSIRCTP